MGATPRTFRRLLLTTSPFSTLVSSGPVRSRLMRALPLSSRPTYSAMSEKTVFERFHSTTSADATFTPVERDGRPTSEISTRRSDWAYGKGGANIAFATVKMTVVEPMPKARDPTATIVKIRLLASDRVEKRRSYRKDSRKGRLRRSR